MKIQIDYFKLSGKWYSEGEYESEAHLMWEIVEELESLDQMPGLCSLGREFHWIITPLDDTIYSYPIMRPVA